MLKARYYSEGSIRNATCPGGGSFMFRSILHGRDLLLEGLVWRIGDGSQVGIHHDNWIPRKGSLKPLGQVFVPGMTKVMHLLNESSTGWDQVKVQNMFPPEEASKIIQIPVGGPMVQDYLAWNYTKNGVFTVRSSYHLCMEKKRARRGSPGSSSSVVNHKAWMNLWDTVAPGRIKVHTWRLLRNGLAVGSELHRRRIKPGVFCAACGREETNLQLL